MSLLRRNHFCILLAFALLASAPGCGGGNVVFPEPRPADDEEETAPSQVAKPAAAPVQKPVAAVPPAQKQAPQPVPATPRAQAIHAAAQQANTGGPASTANLRPRRAVADDDERPTRPVDFSAWTHDDFRAAKADRDVRLVQAVQYLGRSTSNTESNARLLVELLRSDEQDLGVSPDEDPSFTSARANAGLALAIVAALGANQSEPARNALKEILLGRLRSNMDDRTLTVAAFKALIENSGSEAEPLLYTILTMPEAIRPPGHGATQAAGRRVFTGDELQMECAALVRQSASPQLRWRLAEHLAKPSTPAAHHRLLLSMLLEPRSENLRAQAVLAQAEVIGAVQRAALLRQLVVQSRRSIDSLIGACDTSLLRGATDEAVRSALMSTEPPQLQESYRIAEVLWSQTSIDRLAARLRELQNPNESGDLVALTTSLPADELRSIVRERLFKHWTDGDALTKTPQFTASAMRDPGMLLVLKSLPRDDAPARTPPGRGSANNPQQQRQAKERQAKAAWMLAVQTLVTTFNRRFEIAGRVAPLRAARTPTDRPTKTVASVEDFNRLIQERKESPYDAAPLESTPNATQLPLEIPANTELEVVYHLRWPEQLEGRLSASISPLVVHYARLRVEEQGTRLVAFFKRQMKGALEHPIENGRWLDSAERPAPGKLRSVDVMITRSKPPSTVTTVSRRNEREELIVELLWLEINDFIPGDKVFRTTIEPSR